MKTLRLIINKYFTKLLMLILVLSTGYISLSALKGNKYDILSKSGYTRLYFLLAAFLLLCIDIIVYKFIKKSNDKKIKFFNIFLFIFLVIGQVFLISSFNTTQITDPFYIDDYAIAIANGIDKVVDNDWSTYFVNYTNNNLVFMFTLRLIQISNFLGIHNYITFLNVVNAILIDLSIVFTYFIAKDEKDKKFASFVLFLSIFNPLNYVMIFWPYTTTYSLPFMTGLILLWIKLRKGTSNKYILYSVLLGLTISIGYLMRPTLIIPLIALIMIYLFDLINKKCTFNKKTSIICGIVLVSMISSFLLVNLDIKKYIHGQENAFPTTHWIMIGLYGDGTIKTEYNKYTASFKTREEREKATTDAIVKTLHEYKLPGLFKHTLKKLPVTWNDGTSYYMIRMRQDRSPSELYNWIVGDKNDICVLYAQAFRIVTLVSMLYFFAKKYDDKKYGPIDLYSLTLFGAILFYLIWEAKYAYSIPFLPIMLILQAKGIELIIDKEKSVGRIAKRRVFLLVLAATMSLMLIDYGDYVKKPYTYRNYSVYSGNTAARRFFNIYKYNYTLKQEFYARTKFNKISFHVRKLEDNDTKYFISLKYKDKTIYKTSVNRSDVESDDSFITITVPDDIANKLKKGKYTIIIEKDKDKAKDVDSIGWGYILAKALDSYDGVLTINDKVHQNDLFIRVYYLNTTDTYMSKTAYFVIYGLVLGSEVVIYMADKKISTTSKKNKRKDISSK